MDNPRALVVRHDAVSRSVQFDDKLIAFAKHWGFRPLACAPYRARQTESGVGYVKKNASRDTASQAGRHSRRISARRSSTCSPEALLGRGALDRHRRR
jgi:transposase